MSSLNLYILVLLRADLCHCYNKLDLVFSNVWEEVLPNKRKNRIILSVFYKKIQLNIRL